MAAHGRLHVPGALYYVVQSAEPGHALLHSAQDFERAPEWFASALGRLRLRAFAACWLADRVHYLVRIGERPVGLLARSLEFRRAHALGASRSRSAPRPRLSLVQPRYLLTLVRYLYWLPVRVGVSQTPREYSWGTHHYHLNGSPPPWLYPVGSWCPWPIDPQTIQAIFRRGLLPPLPEHVELIESGSRLDARVIGDDDFVRSVVTVAERPTLTELSDTTADAFGISVDELRSHSRRHVLVVARLVFTDQALMRGYGLREVARYLGRTDVDLSIVLKRYRQSHPQLFGLPNMPRDGALRPLV